MKLLWTSGVVKGLCNAETAATIDWLRSALPAKLGSPIDRLQVALRCIVVPRLHVLSFPVGAVDLTTTVGCVH